jgi:hypothetical protein
MLSSYEAKGWIGQIKKNGACTVAFSNGTQTIFKNRHNGDHKLWRPETDHNKFFADLSVNGQWVVFEAELLHSKGNSVKSTLYIFDILVWQGNYLTGKTFVERQSLLQEIFAGRLQDGNDDHWVLEKRIWLAKPLTKDFHKTWKALTHSEDEGIVLKDPNAKLKLCNKPNSNSDWQFKARRPHKNYGF